MEILSPIKSVAELERLVSSGATEFYCGYLPKAWVQQYKDHADVTDMHIPINKREAFADNILEIEEIEKLVMAGDKKNIPIYVTLNRLNYPSVCYKLLEECIEELLKVGVKNFIITDVGLLNWFKVHRPEVNIVVSTCAMSLNNWSNAFYADLGVKRITLPRHISVQEVEQICIKMPDMEFECFILDQGCQYDDGNCRILHGCGAICREQWSYEYYRVDHKAFLEDEIEELYDNERYYTRWLRPYPAKDYRVNNWGTIFCTVCSLPRLINIKNLKSVKIAGRAKDVAEKVRLVRFANDVLEMAEKGANEECLRRYVQTHIGESLCNKKQRCYMMGM